VVFKNKFTSFKPITNTCIAVGIMTVEVVDIAHIKLAGLKAVQPHASGR
jgi:hypothetical protein